MPLDAVDAIGTSNSARSLLDYTLSEEPHEEFLTMATLIIMDHTGDTRHQFDATDAEALLKADERFRELTKVGFTAAVRTPSGDIALARTFDPTAEETLFYPRIVGG